MMFNLEDLRDILYKHNHTITFAESCTGGLVASQFTQISGVSSVFNGSIVTYADEVKVKELNVNSKTIEKYGVVSTEVVQEMLDGVLDKFNATTAVAISGIAGPSGARPNKPVGTVVIGVKVLGLAEDIRVYHFKGDRKNIQKESAKQSFLKIFEIYAKNP